MRVDVALFNCGDGCLGWSGFSGCSFFACTLTGGSPSLGKSVPSPFCFVLGVVAFVLVALASCLVLLVSQHLLVSPVYQPLG